ncbi:hypothetical protein [Gillisia hiemivivida]|uniref:Prenyltransferase n=1 Tax=Gillisia hiemivivida TaxID=291190 RepID=A0A5C6ZRF1_9FLAO|nr:hypothetical protein [Gillisia hiemivivida]TXD92211.1 hypothetical protein ES724_14465 [Gillisia hiemivivida]
MNLKSILNFYISSSIHVALAVVSLVIITMLNFEISLDFNLCLFIFFGAITGYNIVKYVGIAGLHHLSLTKNLRLIQVFSFFIFLALLYILFQLSWDVIVFSAVMGLFTLLYILPFFGGGRNLRALAGVKIYVIAFVWSGVTVLLPLIGKIELLQWDVLLEFTQRFLFVFALTLPFEIRDLKFDMANLRTVAQIFGVRNSKIIGVLTLLTILLLEFIKVESDIRSVISLILISALLSNLIINSRIRQTKYYSSLWVEGVPILWCLLLLGMHLIYP